MKKQKLSIAEGILTIEYPPIGKTFKADLNAYPESIQEDARYHGFAQKFGDAKSGHSAQEKYMMVQRIHENLMSGNWELVSSPDMSAIIIEAVARAKKLKPQVIADSLEKLDDEERETTLKAWGSNVKVKAIIAQIRAERAKKAAEDADEDEIEVPGLK